MVSSLEVLTSSSVLNNTGSIVHLSCERSTCKTKYSTPRSKLIIVLEIGCYSGYSALAWAEALKNVEGAEVKKNPLFEIDGGLTGRLLHLIWIQR